MALSISRRSFMKCVGITAFATATGTLMTGCAQGPITGSFGETSTLTAGGNDILSVTLTGLEWSPFDVGISEINSVLNTNFPNLTLGLWNLTDLTGYGCAMPKGLIQNKSNSTLLVLPYFTGELFDEVFEKVVRPTITENEKVRDTIKTELSSLLERESGTIAKELDTLIQTELGAVVSTALKIIRSGINNSIMPIKPDSARNTLQSALGLTNSSLQTKAIDTLWDFLTEKLAEVGDLFRILMVQGRFNGQTSASKIDQAFNAVAVGYAMIKKKNSLMLNTIAPGSSAAGLLPIPAKRNWRSLLLCFTSQKVDISFSPNYRPSWESTKNTAVEALLYILYIDKQQYLPDITKRLVTNALEMVIPALENKELDLTIRPTDGEMRLDFQNGTLI